MSPRRTQETGVSSGAENAALMQTRNTIFRLQSVTDSESDLQATVEKESDPPRRTQERVTSTLKPTTLEVDESAEAAHALEAALEAVEASLEPDAHAEEETDDLLLSTSSSSDQEEEREECSRQKYEHEEEEEVYEAPVPWPEVTPAEGHHSLTLTQTLTRGDTCRRAITLTLTLTLTRGDTCRRATTLTLTLTLTRGDTCWRATPCHSADTLYARQWVLP